MAGYSGTPLARKLGIKAGHRLALVNAPDGFAGQLDPPDECIVGASLRGRIPIDVVVLFVTTAAALQRRFAIAQRRIAKDGGVWVAWPKKASGMPTDLDGNAVRAHGLAAGLVDNKVCAIDETWSGLRFCWRRQDR